MEHSLHLDRMSTMRGLSTVTNILKEEMERRFTMFQDPHEKSFKTLYVVATFLDPRYRIVLSSLMNKRSLQNCISYENLSRQVI